jgi:hypothetical protein
MALLGPRLRALVPAVVRRRLRDGFEAARRRFPAPPRALPQYGLTATQVYPQGENFDLVLEQAIAGKLDGLGLGPRTPVASIGTCFAEEFAHFMQARGMNYVRTEPDVFAASANWGRVYTIPNLLQIVRYSLEPDFPLTVERSERGYFDPLRDYATPHSGSESEAKDAVRRHRQASRDAFMQCEVAVITVGQNEAWTDRATRLIWGRMPPKEILESRRSSFDVREFSLAENRTALGQALDALKRANPKVRFLLTVSPVPSFASFTDSDVVSRSFANKCVLRAVVDDAIASRSGHAFYFPSFEMVLCYNPTSFRADNRHVKYGSVDRIFGLLERTTGLARPRSAG